MVYVLALLSATALLSAYTDSLNARLGCKAVSIGENADWSVRWATWPEYADRFDGRRRGGVSALDQSRSEIWIATDEIPTQLAGNGLLSDCEVGYLWMFWIGHLAGLPTQYTDPSRITYGHPDCRSGDLVGELISEFQQAHIEACE